MKILILILLLFSFNQILAQDWQTDFDKAKEIATTKDLPIILVFQGSDWCTPCIKLDRDVWSTETFESFAKEHYVMLRADFPRRKKNALPKAQVQANAQLAETYNKNGIFPLVVVLDKEGKKLGEAGYKKTTPQEYIEQLNAFIQ